MDEDVKHLRDEKNIDRKQLKFKTCPACQMKKDKSFEGEVIINLSGKGAAAKNEILHLIKNTDDQARFRDTLDRVLWTQDSGNEIHIFTSENQLAVMIGKKLDSAFKGGKLGIKYSHQEDPIRVHWQY